MRLQRVRNRILQRMYRPPGARRVILPSGTMAALDEINDLIEQKITPLLSGLWKE